MKRTELADTSVWTNRHKDPHLHASFDRVVSEGRVATCGMVVLELLVQGRDRNEIANLREALSALPEVPITRGAWQRAAEVMEALAGAGPLHHRRVSLPDLVIAAAGEHAGLTITHYDRDFDLIADVTGQPVRAIAPLGSL